MSERIHGLAQLLPGKSSLDECSLEELQQLTNRYPFFAPAQFLLLQKLKKIGSPDHEALQQKAVLYFHDPLQFEHFISFDQFYFDEAHAALVDATIATPGAANTIDEVRPSEAVLAEEQAPIETVGTEDESVFDAEEPTVTIATSQKEVFIFPEPDKVEEGEAVEVAEPAVLPVSPFPETSQPSQASIKAGTTETANKAEAGNTVVAPKLTVAPVQETRDEKVKETSQTKVDTSAISVAKPSEVSPAVPANEPLAFEPYHTVDYFASQGIKITAEELPKDKLSKQLRSFTEWLKVMKRLPAAEIAQTQESTAEKTVENMASHSVEGSDVVTEAMAEVWAKQGNKQKAIETYNKLSLLNPSKKAYFAAKIENLRGS